MPLGRNNYTVQGEIVRGSKWPPADDSLTVQITKSSGWPAAATAWVWKLLLSRHLLGGTPDLSLTGTDTSISGNVLTVKFAITPVESAALPGDSQQVFQVDLRSTVGGIVSYYDAMQGYAQVRDFVGES